MNERWERVAHWFEQVSDLDPAERAAVFEREDVDEDVREEVLSLCAAEERAGERLEPSPGFSRVLGGGIAPPDDERGLEVGAYRLEAPLGRGGMGTVWRARRIDDVYSLGVVLYQLLTGELPHRITTHSASAIERAICDERPVRPSTAVARRGTPPPDAAAIRPLLPRELAGDLDTIILKALHKEPERRYTTVEQLSEDVRRHLEGLPVIARPDTFAYRARKFVGRNRLGVAVAAIVFVLLTGSLLVIAELLGEARAAQAQTQRRLRQVRELTGEMIFDLHDEIAHLPGATAARHRLLDTGLRYLDTLLLDAGEDAELLRELADGYTRLAEVQGRPTAASLGDTAAALASHGKARALLDRLVAQRPDDGELQRARALAEDGIGTIELRAGRASDALERFESCLDVARAHGTTGDLALVLYHKIEALAVLGRTAAALTVGEDCLAAARSWRAERPSDPDTARTLHVVLFKLADLHSTNRSFARAEEEILEAIDIATERYERAPQDAQATRDLALVLALLGRIRIDDGRAAEAADAVGRQMELFAELAAADPRNLVAKKDLSLAHERRGSLHAAQGRLEDALGDYRRCVELLGPPVAADPDDAKSGRALALGHMRFGQLHLGERDFPAALDAFLRSRDAYAALARRDPEHAWTRRQEMVAVYFVGWAHRELGHDENVPPADRRGHLREAVTALERSLELQRTLGGLGMLQPGDEDQEPLTEAEIAACSALLDRIE